MRFAIRPPAQNQRGPRFIEPVLDAVHQAGHRRAPLHLEIASEGGEVGVFADVPESLRRVFLGSLQDASEGCQVSPTEATTLTDELKDWSLALRLTPDAVMMRTWKSFEDSLSRVFVDPLPGILSSARTGRSGRIETQVRLTIRPASSFQYDEIRFAARCLDRWFLLSRLGDWHRALCTSRLWSRRVLAWLLRFFSIERESTDSSDDKLNRHLFECQLILTVRAPGDAGSFARQKLNELAAGFGVFTSNQAWFMQSRIRKRTRPLRRDRFLLCSEEIATLWHPPTETTDSVSRIQRNLCPEPEPPMWLPSPHRDRDVTELGRVQYRGRKDRFGIRLDDRRRHLFICGKTGMGKSTLMLNMLTSDIRAGRGVCLIDPHGDLADAVRTVVPKRRRNDVILFDAGDRTSPIAWNPLACSTQEQRPLVAEGVLAAMKKVFAESWGPRMEDILRHGLLALLETPGTTLLSLQRLLVEPNFRRSIVGRVADPVVRAYWEQTFAGWNDRFRSEAISPVQNKLGQFLANPLTRNIIDAPQSRIDLRRIMDRGQILIVNLSQGRIGEPASNLLGAFLVSSLHLSAMSRADTPEPDRRDFMCYVDEFQNFATESFASILSQARKYRLSLTMACQYLDQMDEATQHAVFGNVGSLVSFQVGIRDAELLAEQIGQAVTATNLTEIEKHRAYTRLQICGHPSGPFIVETLNPVADSRKASRMPQASIGSDSAN